MRRVKGSESGPMALLMRRRAEAFCALKRFAEARAALEGMKIHEQVSGRSSGYIDGLLTLADISYNKGDFEEGLKRIEEARSLISSDVESEQLTNVLNMHALLLQKLGRFVEALPIRLEHIALSIRLYGPNHPEYATSCHNTAILYSELNQMQKAIDLMKEALAIRMKTL